MAVRTILVVAILLLIGDIAIVVYITPSEKSGSHDLHARKLGVSQLGFGMQLMSDQIECAVEVTNPNNSVVAVSHVKASCGCTEVEPKSFSIHARQTMPLNLAISPSPQFTSLEDEYPISIAIRGNSDDYSDGEAFNCRVRGVVIPPFIIQNAEHGVCTLEIPPGETTIDQVVRLRCRPELKIVRAETDLSQVVVDSISAMRSNNEVLIHCTVKAKKDWETLRGKLSIHWQSSPGSEGLVGNWSVPLKIKRSGNLKVSPTYLAFGIADINERMFHEITITTKSEDEIKSFQFEKGTWGHRDMVTVSIEPSKEAGVLGKNFVVSVQGKSEGLYKGTLLMRIDTKCGQTYRHELEASLLVVRKREMDR